MVNIAVVNPGQAASNTASFVIQEELLPDGTRGTPNQRFLSEFYRDNLNRLIDAGGLAFWENGFTKGLSETEIAREIEQDSHHEFYGIEVQGIYQQYLHRAADAGGLAYFTNSLATGSTVEQVIAAIVTDSGKEFSNGQTNGTFNSFLNALDMDALGQGVNATDAAYANDTPAQAAAAILSTNEYHTDLVKQYYAQLLGRGVDSGDQVWINELDMGIRDEVVIAGIVGDYLSEYFMKTAP